MSSRSSWCHAAASAALGLSFMVAPARLLADTYGPELIDFTRLPAVPCPATAGSLTIMCLTAYPTYVSGTLFVPGPASFRDLNIATQVGTTYHVSYAIGGKGSVFGPARLDAFWGNALLSSTTLGLFGSGTLTFAFDVVATGPTTRLEFASQLTGICDRGNCDDWGYLTAVGDVSVRAVTSTPEPATFALVGSGLALVGVAGRRRRARR